MHLAEIGDPACRLQIVRRGYFLPSLEAIDTAVASEEQIAARIGQERFDALFDALEADWGDNIERAPKR